MSQNSQVFPVQAYSTVIDHPNLAAFFFILTVVNNGRLLLQYNPCVLRLMFWLFRGPRVGTAVGKNTDPSNYPQPRGLVPK